MTYFPPPYSPPPDFGFVPVSPMQELKPARQASIILFVLGGLAIIFGLMSFVLSMVSLDDWPVQERDNFLQLIQPSGLSAHSALMIYSLMMIVPGIGLCVLGFLVRHGRAIVPTMIAVGLMILFMAWTLLNAMAGGQGSSACPAVGILIALGAVMTRLIAVLPAMRQAKMMQAQLQSQYWQSQLFEPEEEYGYGEPNEPPK